MPKSLPLMTNILFIAYEFPPLNRGGVFRSLYFAKYFNNFGIKPFIITLDNAQYDKIYSNVTTDENLLDIINDKRIDIIKIQTENLLSKNKNKIKNFLRIFFNFTKGSEYNYWKKDFYKKTCEIIKNKKIEAIFVTAPPFGVLSQAVNLSKKHNLPLIVDMRDAWTYWITSPYPTKWHFNKTLKKERFIFENANKIIVTSKQTIKDFISLHPNISSNKYVYIPNGYDEEIDFLPFNTNFSNKKEINITYIGSFYYSPKAQQALSISKKDKRGYKKLQYIPREENWLYRSPYFFFQTLNKLFKKFPQLQTKIFIKLAGSIPDWLLDMIKKFDLEKNISLLGFVSKDKALELEKQADILLITSSKVVNGKDYSIAGKTFEYFTMQKPILSFVTEGAQKDLLLDSGLAVLCNPDDLNTSVENLKRLVEENNTFSPNVTLMKGLHRKKLTEQLSKIIKDEILN